MTRNSNQQNVLDHIEILFHRYRTGALPGLDALPAVFTALTLEVTNKTEDVLVSGQAAGAIALKQYKIFLEESKGDVDTKIAERLAESLARFAGALICHTHSNVSRNQLGRTLSEIAADLPQETKQVISGEFNRYIRDLPKIGKFGYDQTAKNAESFRIIGNAIGLEARPLGGR